MMKLLLIPFLLIVLFTSCKNETTKARKEAKSADTVITTTTQDIFEDSIATDKYISTLRNEMPNLNYKRSLQYILGDYAFDVSVYFKEGKQVVYVEDGHNSKQDYRRLNVFLKDEKPIYAELAEKISMGSNNEFREAKVYFNQKLQVLKALERKTKEENKIQDIPFVSFTPDTSGYSTKADFFKHAVDCTEEFDLPFLEIQKTGPEEFLVLGKTDPNTYRTKLLIRKADETIKELKSNAGKYKGKKLDIQWTYENIGGNERLVYLSGKLL